MKKQFITTTLLTGLTMCIASTASATLVTELVFKLSDSSTTRLDAQTGWSTAGGFNNGVAGATLLTDNGLDYRNTLIDSWPTDMTNVHVAFYENGVEQAFTDFDPTGTTNTNFFTQAQTTLSSWTDIAGTGNFFSIDGDIGIDRHWFVNNNYGGCPNDIGQFVVIDGDGSQPCTWESNRLNGNNRAFLYSTTSTQVNWNSQNVGIADVFAVFITRDVTTTVPAPGILALFSLGLAGLRYRRAPNKRS